MRVISFAPRLLKSQIFEMNPSPNWLGYVHASLLFSNWTSLLLFVM